MTILWIARWPGFVQLPPKQQTFLRSLISQEKAMAQLWIESINDFSDRIVVSTAGMQIVCRCGFKARPSLVEIHADGFCDDAVTFLQWGQTPVELGPSCQIFIRLTTRLLLCPHGIVLLSSAPYLDEHKMAALQRVDVFVGIKGYVDVLFF